VTKLVIHMDFEKLLVLNVEIRGWVFLRWHTHNIQRLIGQTNGDIYHYPGQCLKFCNNSSQDILVILHFCTKKHRRIKINYCYHTAMKQVSKKGQFVAVIDHLRNSDMPAKHDGRSL
jgi:hypothetical protein